MSLKQKVFAICFTDQCLARLKESTSSCPPRKLLILAADRAIAQSHYCISNDVKAKLSRKFHAETTLLASAFAKPMKIFFRTKSQLNVLYFCLRSAFTFIFQAHMEVALIQD